MATNIHNHVETPLEVTNNAAMREVLQAMYRLASSDLSMLITGEHGTGKEWAARLIHNLSPRVAKPFLPFDCASIAPEQIERELFGFEALTRDGVTLRRGALEDASGGTLLLNEIAALPSTAQAKIARALEYQTLHRVDGDQSIKIDVRVISTLSEDHESLIRSGTLSKDMFYRISALVVELPPLRERREDIPLLIRKFLTELHSRNSSSAMRIAPEALQLCLEYKWPGNIRHLKNAIEYASIMCTRDSIQRDDLPSYLQGNNSNKKHATSTINRKR